MTNEDERKEPTCRECGLALTDRRHLEGLNGIHEGVPVAPLADPEDEDETSDEEPAAPANPLKCPLCEFVAVSSMKLGGHTKSEHSLSLAGARAAAEMGSPDDSGGAM